VACATWLVLINNFNTYGVSGLSYYILIQFIVRLKTMEVLDLGSHFPVIAWYITLQYPHINHGIPSK